MEHSTWIAADGAAKSLDWIPGHPIEHRGFALDTLGWVNVCETQRRVEVWVNPLKVTRRAIAAASDVLASIEGRHPGRELIVRVHDHRPRGSVIARSVDELPRHLTGAIELTSQPGFPLVQDRLDPALVTEIADEHVRDTWAYLNATGFALTKELVGRVEASTHRVKLLLLGQDGSAQYLAHDRSTQQVWGQRAPLAGRFLEDLPVPVSLARSLRADIRAMLSGNETVVSYLRGLAKIMPGASRAYDSFFRITVPLELPAGLNEAVALVMLSKIG